MLYLYQDKLLIGEKEENEEEGGGGVGRKVYLL